MLFPKKVKYRKWQTMRKNPLKVGVATRGVTVAFGSYGLKALAPARIRSNQIESARKVLSRSIGKTGIDKPARSLMLRLCIVAPFALCIR